MAAPGDTDLGAGLLASDEPFVLRMRPRLHARDGTPPVARIRTPAGDDAWLVAHEAEIKDLLRDSRLGRSHPDPATMPRYAGNPVYDHAISADHAVCDAMHDRLRTLVRPHFTARRMLALRPAIQAVVDDAVTALVARGAPADLHADFAAPVTVTAIGELLGVPVDERGHAMALLGDPGGLGDTSSPDTLAGYFCDLAGRRRAAPAEDTISGLVAAGASDVETAQLAELLLFAGIGSTVKQIDYGFLLLDANPDQRAALAADPGLATTAVEELLRCAGSLSLPRWAREPIETCGVTIGTGELVLLDLTLANLDGAEGELDLARSPNRHLSFSYGMWACLGAPLARILLQCVFTTLLARLPGVRLAVEPEELAVTSDPLGGGLTEYLPVRW